jgi:hypothetical protein
VSSELGADDAAGTGAIVDNHLLPEALAQSGRHHAPSYVAAAARWKWNDHPDRLGRIILRRHGRRQGEDECGGDERRQGRLWHRVLSRLLSEAELGRRLWLVPQGPCGVDHQAKLGELLLGGHHGVADVAGKAALRAEAQAVHRHKGRRLPNALAQIVL